MRKDVYVYLISISATIETRKNGEPIPEFSIINYKILNYTLYIHS
ncbi:hypothetical protein BH09BAC2_BH09BAC2_00350 [soil metagenome]